MSSLNLGDITFREDDLDVVLKSVNDALGSSLTQKNVFVKDHMATIEINEIYGDISTELKQLVLKMKEQNVFLQGCITELGDEETQYCFEDGEFQIVSEQEAWLKATSDTALKEELQKRNLISFDELNEYDANHKRVITSKDTAADKKYQIIFKIQNERYYCDVWAASLTHAYGIFFMENSHICYNDVEAVDRTEPATNSFLKGWTWNHYYDGSGCLETPDGSLYLEYDLQTQEYKEKGKRWYFFPDYPEHMSLSSFVKYTENEIVEKLKKEKKNEY